MIKIPSTAILTGISALSFYDIVAFNPEYITVAMPLGSNPIAFSSFPNLRISRQKDETLDYESINDNGIRIYSLERLFVELNLFELNLEHRGIALKKLEKIVDPYKVKKIYEFLSKKRRGLNATHVEEFLEKNIVDIKKIISNRGNVNYDDLVREIIINHIYKLDVPILLKGGSAVEILTNAKRSTEDIDAHTGRKTVIDIFNYFKDTKNNIYFNIFFKDKPLDMSTFSVLVKEKKIIPLVLKANSRIEAIKVIVENRSIDITFNFSYSDEEIMEIINTFSLVKGTLRILQKPSCITFSKEMIMAEKFNALITNPEYQTRTKDLFDLNSLSKDGYDFNLLKQWFFKQCKVLRQPLDELQAIEMIRLNKDKELLKIKDDFKATARLFDVELSFEDGVKIYKELINKFLENY